MTTLVNDGTERKQAPFCGYLLGFAALLRLHTQHKEGGILVPEASIVNKTVIKKNNKKCRQIEFE